MKQDLRLTAYFSVVSIPVMLLAMGLLVYIFHLLVLESLQRQVEQNNVIVARSLANMVWGRIQVLEGRVAADAGETADELIASLNTDVRQFLSETPVLKVKVFNIGGNTVYSSDNAEINFVKPADYPGSVSAATGKPISLLSSRDKMHALEGEVRDVEVLSTYIPKFAPESGGVEGVLEIYTDVTPARRAINDSLMQFTLVLGAVFAFIYFVLFMRVRYADAEVQHNKRDLEQKVVEVEDLNVVLEQNANDLKLARDVANHANSAKSQFLANMSHELRTPLNAILGYTELVRESAIERGDEPSRQDLDKVVQAGKHLLELINSILDLSKVEAGQMGLHRERFDVALLLREVVDTLKPVIDKNHNTVRLDIRFEGLFMLGDMVKLRQILFNLVSNAAKFTREGAITLGAHLRTVNGEQQIVFQVSDTGIGVDSKHIGRLFCPFEQGDSSNTRKYGGTGLGLAISKRFCNMMEGDIDVESEPGKGTTFTVHLPFLSEPATVGAMA